MRCFLLLISLCIAYTPATSQGLSKPCVRKEDTSGIRSIAYRGCMINGVCQPYGKGIKQALSCMVYVCKRKGRLSYVRHEVTGCRLNRRCYECGKIINLRTCIRLTCTYSPVTGYKWKKELRGCRVNGVCYPDGGKIRQPYSCLVYTCERIGHVFYMRQQTTGCLLNYKCYQNGRIVTAKRTCERFICTHSPVTGYKWKREFTGCLDKNVCYKTGKKYKLKHCRYGICKKLENGYNFFKEFMGCPINDQCLPVGTRKRFNCFDLYCRKIRFGAILETKYKGCS
uniref:Uncharacterized protein n=1 Tax=Octopus bimaculoides TaxID=37653 RepID=A0A0L8HLW9_OCTBM|eukprot:XP_014771282.1 PREDICTED: uncharacterized protein LOC106869873 isoform X3 [Octopus bimaculoides]